jgi:hypothetical protein
VEAEAEYERDDGWDFGRGEGSTFGGPINGFLKDEQETRQIMVDIGDVAK